MYGPESCVIAHWTNKIPWTDSGICCFSQGEVYAGTGTFSLSGKLALAIPFEILFISLRATMYFDLWQQIRGQAYPAL